MSMEKVYPPRKLGYASPVIDLKNFFNCALAAEDEFYEFFHGKKRTADEVDTRTNFQCFMQRFGQPNEITRKVLFEVDNSLAVIIKSFPIIDYDPAFPPYKSKLISHKIIDEIRKDAESSKTKSLLVSRNRYFKHKQLYMERPLQSIREVADKDFVITVNMMKPLNFMRCEGAPQSQFRSMCEIKFLLRGDMPLTKLREKITCQADIWLNVEDTDDVSENDKYYIYKFPSSFMFIYDTFYVDDSSDQCIDISAPIQEFMKRKNTSFGPFYVKRMSETRVTDLKLRLGFPYIFVHQGHCEHLMIFSDLRLMNVNDIHDLNEYPFCIYEALNPIKCCACKDAFANYVVTESDRMPICPAFMCESCFKAFHYDRNLRLGNFKAYHYVDRNALE